MTPEQLDTVRRELPVFGDRPVSHPALDAYRHFYAIDFTSRFPGIEQHTGYVRSDPYELATHSWSRPGAVANLFIVHGYYDHTGLFGKLVRWGLDNACNVLAFDLPGHGLSTGEPAVIHRFTEYGRAIEDVLAAQSLPDLPLWAMGQSTGCAALVEFSRRGHWPFAATVLLAPLVRPAGWRGVQIAHRLLSPVVSSVPRAFNVNSGDESFLAFVRDDPLQCQRVPFQWLSALRDWLRGLERADLGVGPALLIQGDRDGTVDWRFNVPFMLDLFPGTRVEYVQGAGHQLANETTLIRTHYLSVVSAYLAGKGIKLGSIDQS